MGRAAERTEPALHNRLAVQGRDVGDDGRACLAVGLVGVRRCLAGAGLDENLGAIADQLAGDQRRQCDASLSFGGLARNSDLHRADLCGGVAQGEPP